MHFCSSDLPRLEKRTELHSLTRWLVFILFLPGIQSLPGDIVCTLLSNILMRRVNNPSFSGFGHEGFSRYMDDYNISSQQVGHFRLMVTSPPTSPTFAIPGTSAEGAHFGSTSLIYFYECTTSSDVHEAISSICLDDDSERQDPAPSHGFVVLAGCHELVAARTACFSQRLGYGLEFLV